MPARSAGDCCADIDLDDVGKLAERYAWIIGSEVVERDAIAKRLQPLAGGDDAVLGFDRLQNLGHGLVRGKQRNQILEQDFTGAIHEGEPVVAKRVHTKKQRGIEGRAGGEFRIGIEIIFDSVAEKKFVSEHPLRDGRKLVGGQRNVVPAAQARSERRSFFWRERVALFLHRRGRGGTSGGKLRHVIVREARGSLVASRWSLGKPCSARESRTTNDERPTTTSKPVPNFGNVDVENLGHSPLAQWAVSRVTSEVFPMAMLPGGPFAPSKTPGALV